MASAVIGALRVNLGIDSASFNRGLSTAEARAERFGRVIGSSLRRNLVALGAAAAAVAGPAALGFLVKSSMETISAQVDLARRVGASVAAIQTLQHATELAGGSQEGLAKALGTLNARLGEAAREGAGPAYEALQRLGVSAKELSEMDADERVKTLADRMTELGYTTQQQSDTLKSFGIRQQELNNLFIEGSAAIDRAREDLKAWGVLLTDVDAAKVEAAGDALDRIGTVLQGVGNRIAVEIAPLLTEMAEGFTDAARESGGFGDAIRQAVTLAVQLFGALQREIYAFRIGLDESIADVLNLWDALAGAPANILATVFGGKAEDYGFKPINESFGRLRETLEKPPSAEEWDIWLDNIRKKADAAAAAADPASRSGSGDGEEETEAEAKAGAKLQEQLATKLATLQESLMTEREAELNSYATRMVDLQDFLNQGLITKQEYDELSLAAERDKVDKLKQLDDETARSAKKAADMRGRAMDAILGDIKSVIGSIFGDSKGAAIAMALIDTAQAVTKTLAQYGATPWGWAAAAAAAAAGAAQIAAIRKTTIGGGGSKPSVTGGGSSAAAAAAAAPSAAAPRGVDIRISGLSRGQLFDGAGIRSLIEQINEQVGDGVQLRFA